MREFDVLPGALLMTDDEFKKLWDRASADISTPKRAEEFLAREAEDMLASTELERWARIELGIYRQRDEQDIDFIKRIMDELTKPPL